MTNAADKFTGRYMHSNVHVCHGLDPQCQLERTYMLCSSLVDAAGAPLSETIKHCTRVHPCAWTVAAMAASGGPCVHQGAKKWCHVHA